MLSELLQNEGSVSILKQQGNRCKYECFNTWRIFLQTLALVDGCRINDVGMGGVNFTLIPASIIERIEIIRFGGCGSLWNGCFWRRVVNVITKKATETAFSGHFDISERSKLSLNRSIYESKVVISYSKNEQKDSDKYIKFDYDFNTADKSFLNLSGYSHLIM